MNKVIVILAGIILVLIVFLGYGLSKLNNNQDIVDSGEGAITTIDMNLYSVKAHSILGLIMIQTNLVLVYQTHLNC